MARALKWLTGLVAAVLLLLALGIAALWWWSGTQDSLDRTLRWIARTQPLTAEGAQGSLRSGMQVRRLQWERDGLRVEAQDLSLAWHPLALLQGVVHLDTVRATALRVTDSRPPSPERPQPPVSLRIKPRLQLDELAVGRFEWHAATTVQADDIAARYAYDGATHRLWLDSLNVLGGAYRGEAKLGTDAPLPLEAILSGEVTPSVPGTTTTFPLVLAASVRGPLADLQAQVLLRGTRPVPAGSEPTQATVTAHITPWGEQPVGQAQAVLRSVDLGALWAQGPRTQLSGEVRVQPTGTATWHASVDLRNSLPGPWDKQRLPVDSIKAQGEWQGGTALVRQLDARLGGGSLHATGRWQGPDGGWTLQADLLDVDPAALHTRMAAVPLGGRIEARQELRGIAFDVALLASGRSAPAAAREGAKPDELAATLGALELRSVAAKGRWLNGTLLLPMLDVRTTDATLQGSLEAQPDRRAGKGKVELRAPGLRADLDGDMSQTRGRGTLVVDGSNLAETQRWLQRLPGVPEALSAQRVDGRATLRLSWQGGWDDPTVDASLASPQVDVRAPIGPQPVPNWTVRDATLTAKGRLSDAAVAMSARAQQAKRQVTLDLAARGGRQPLREGAPTAWAANVERLVVSVQDPALGAGAWRLASQRGFDVRGLLSGSSIDVGAGQAVLYAPAVPSKPVASQAVLAWDPVRWRDGELTTAGRLAGLPLGWLELVGGAQLVGSALTGDMLFDAQWDAKLGSAVRLNASLARSGGDITVQAEDAQGQSVRVAAGVRDARLTLASRGEEMTLVLRWDSERAGTADGRLVTRLVHGDAGWDWPETATISGQLTADLPRIGVWSVLAPPGWRLRGSLSADVKIGGTRGDPQLAGTLQANDLALRSVVDGIELRDGRLRARLDGRRVVVSEFSLHGAGERDGGGTLLASGEATWAKGGAQLLAQAELTRLRASSRSDLQLTVSGNLTARVDSNGTDISGKLRVDQARIELPAETAPRLGDDVVVRNSAAMGASAQDRKAESHTPVRTQGPTQPPAPAKAIQLAVDLDLGDDFRVKGRGLNTRVSGTLALSGRSVTAPRLVGTISTQAGEFEAYGQKLDIERGVLRFTGPVDNPALDILAVRPNITQKVGVLVTGRAQAPLISLYSEPDLPDAEKLAWLLTGRPAPSGGAEAALVQEAALALLAKKRSDIGGGSQRGLLGTVGLDQVSVRRDDKENTVVTLGKRFSRNFYASYERSLSGALGTLYIFYDVSRKLTIRAEAGERTGVDLIYTFLFD